MEIIKKSQSGSFESSDIIILIEPVEPNSGRNIDIDSSVMLEYGATIKKLINSKLDSYKISDIHLIAKDKGALELTINARLETAIKRACNIQKATMA
ncbi:citrate lyase acyl carrier protein [Lutibacter sp. A80]|uniref:citrate lyase acyl carrier protein n=1 Tax=Lutibacter sp. A80 TaxID=2918453 RepID=UPI001F0612E8|nr:citrate lyase acyl carrier protein [Lutibacter sp. A80]UMB59553.1 citrate lyase acyl carrier protein [Lutibacter sp. A80]